MVFPSGPDADLPAPEPFWLTLLATLCGLVVPAVTALGAVVLLGPPNIPHTSRLAAIAAGALTLAEAVFAGLVAGALVEAAWSRLPLPGSGPVDYLPVRWMRRRIARRRGGSGRISRVGEQVAARMGEPPVSEQVAAVVQAYEALLSDRPHRPALSRREAFAELRAMGGGLDPDVVEALIEVETPNGSGRFARVPILGRLGPPVSVLLRRGRHVVRTSVTPAAAGATVLAMAAAGMFGLLPAWRGTNVLALRYPGPSVVVRTTPTPTSPADAASPSASSATPPAPSPSPPKPNDSGTVGAAPRLYFPPPPARTAKAPGRPATPGATGPATGQPGSSPTPTTVYVTESAVPITVLPPSPSASPTPTPAPTKSTPAPGPVADRFVWANQAGTSAAIVSPPLSTTSANELILAFVSSDGPANSPQSVGSVFGGGLSWRLAARANTQSGTAEVWQAYATARLTGATFVAALANVGQGGSMTVAAFSGAAAAVGAVGTAGAVNGAPQVPVTTTKAGSVVWAVGHDPDQAVARTPLGGQTIVHEFLDPAAHASWVQAAGPIPAANSVVTMGDSAPALDRWEMAAVEIPSAQ